MVIVFSLRGVTPVMCETDNSVSFPVTDSSSTSRKKYFARRVRQWLGIWPSHTPESV